MKITLQKAKILSRSAGYKDAYYQGEPPAGISALGQQNAITPLVELAPGHPGYPKGLSNQSPILFARGNLELLQRPLTGIFSSVNASGRAILRAIEWTQNIPNVDIVVVSGFHAPVEQECLSLLLRRGVPVIVCAAREIATYRPPLAWRAYLNAEKMLLLSSLFGKRITVAASHERNRMVVDLATEIVILHAEPDSSTERLAREAVAHGKLVRWLE